MIDAEKEAEILRLFHVEKWRIGTIATQLGIHHSTVRRVLAQNGIRQGKQPIRPSIVEPYLPFIEQTLGEFPRLTASRLFHMVRERGYPGGEDHFRSIVARLRPKPPAEAFLRLRTLPGEQAQVDWGHFGKLTIGRAVRRLMAFVMVLSHSRMIFLRFFLGHQMASFVRGHVAAFEHFGGVARRLIYDNLKSVVIERRGDAIRFHEKLLELAGHYRFEPRPAAPYRGNEKGRVERGIRYVRTSFFAARLFVDLDDLNAQAHQWATGLTAERRWPDDRTRTVGEVFAEEKPRLLALPDHRFCTDEVVEVHVGKTPYVRFDKNDYSVPHTSVRRTLSVVASLETVRIVDGTEVVATHERTFDQGKTVEDPTHIQALADEKKRAREHRTLDELHHALPSVGALLGCAAERGANLGSMVWALHRLLGRYGPEPLERAIAQALSKQMPHLGAIRQLLETERRAQGKPPPLAAALPTDPRIRDLVVKPHRLDDYDLLNKETDDDEEPAD